jgi:uncharacterized protein YbjT (DUF2867 family)
MKLILFGATGMVGMGTLREALADPTVESVLCVSRRSCGVKHSKLREILVADLFDVTSVEPHLAGWDACAWCVGVSVLGKEEAEYARMTEELTLVWARASLRANPRMSFCYCSAAGAGGKAMWARVRQRVESAIEAMPFQHKGVVRPGFIRPGPGIRSGVRAYRAAIAMFAPFAPLLVKVFPSWFTTSERLGRAMLRVVQGRADRFILESADINRLGQ